ncbi:MAG: prolyl oligopeptidase family serine peptidase, partial [Bacteroidota bacterium]
WNFHLMAAKGYIVVAPNRRGLPGFGQAWNEQISGDWGGQAMKDMLWVTDSVKKLPFVDAGRMAAVGASFGGYTVYWLAGNHDGRFKSFIAHCGVYNLESMFGQTEEIFF